MYMFMCICICCICVRSTRTGVHALHFHVLCTCACVYMCMCMCIKICRCTCTHVHSFSGWTFRDALVAFGAVRSVARQGIGEVSLVSSLDVRMMDRQGSRAEEGARVSRHCLVSAGTDDVIVIVVARGTQNSGFIYLISMDTVPIRSASYVGTSSVLRSFKNLSIFMFRVYFIALLFSVT